MNCQICIACLKLFRIRSLLAAQAAVPRHEMAVVTGVRNFVRLFGSTIALAICAAIVNNSLRSAIAPLGLTAEQIDALVDDPTIVNDASKINLSDEARRVVIAGYMKGFRGVFYLTLACTLVAFLSAVLLVEQHELAREDDKELKRQGHEFIQQRKSRNTAPKDLEAGALSARASTVAEANGGGSSKPSIRAHIDETDEKLDSDRGTPDLAVAKSES